MRRAGIEETRNVYTVFVGKYLRKRSLGLVQITILKMVP
jgi:hypothetical protein